MAFAPDGTLYFIDIHVVCKGLLTGCGPGSNGGRVMRVTVTNGQPSAPVAIASGFDFPTSVTMCVPATTGVPVPDGGHRRAAVGPGGEPRSRQGPLHQRPGHGRLRVTTFVRDVVETRARRGTVESRAARRSGRHRWSSVVLGRGRWPPAAGHRCATPPRASATTRPDADDLGHGARPAPSPGHAGAVGLAHLRPRRPAHLRRPHHADPGHGQDAAQGVGLPHR